MIKKIVNITQVTPNGEVIIDARNPLFSNVDFISAINNFIPQNRVFEKITLKNFTIVNKDLLRILGTHYAHGTEITLHTPKNNFCKSYKMAKGKPYYNYNFVNFDFTAPIKKSLANFQFEHNGAMTTYLNEIKQLKTTNYIPNHIWQAIDKYSQSRITEMNNYNKDIYDIVELFYKKVLKDGKQSSIVVFSPNEKTYFEAVAELDFDKRLADYRLQDDEKPLTTEQKDFLFKYAKYYDVDIKPFMWRYNTRKTNHGYTQEPEIVTHDMGTTDWARVIYDPRNENKDGEKLPKAIRHNLTIKAIENEKNLLNAYNQLKWLIDNMGDDALNPNYKRCSHCNELYNIHSGCENCEKIPPIEFLQANNLFYGDTSQYEDFDAMQETYDNLQFEIDD